MTPGKKIHPNELAAIRAQAYPEIIDDNGAPWYMNAISQRDEKIKKLEVLRELFVALENENTLLKEALYCYALLKWPIPTIGYFPDMAEIRKVQDRVNASYETARRYLIMTGGNVEEAVTRIVLDNAEV